MRSVLPLGRLKVLTTPRPNPHPAQIHEERATYPFIHSPLIICGQPPASMRAGTKLFTPRGLQDPEDSNLCASDTLSQVSRPASHAQVSWKVGILDKRP